MEAGRERRQLRVDRRAALGLVAAGALAAAVKPALAGASEGGGDAAAVAVLEALLERNLLPFWRRVLGRSLAVEGYELNVDEAGRWLQPSNRLLIPQARTTWSFAHLARTRWARPGDRATARHGFAYLTRRMWDPEHGGFFWEVDQDTHLPVKPDKYLVGQAHALLALSEHALATNSARARAWADRAAAAIDDHLRDPRAGDYVDFRLRDWSAPPPGVAGYTGLPPEVRSYNARFRLLDALTAYHELARTRRSRARLREAVAIAERGLATEPAHYFRATDPASGEPRVSYATDMQTVHQLRRARALLGLADNPLYERVLDDDLRWGEDRRRGGIYAAGDPGRPADDRVKYGWMQAEALLATCDSWVRTGDVRHRAAFWRTLLWITRRQADWAHGEWRYALGDGAPAEVREAPFHNMRAVLYALELLEARGPR